MKQSMGYVLACSLSLFACHFEHWEDCDDDDFESGHHSGSAGKAGSSPQAGSEGGGSGGGTTGAGGGSGGTTTAGTGGRSNETAGAGGAEDPGPRPISCKDERDCPKGYNCNLDSGECEAATEETCAELVTEAACAHRTDCTPIYAGTNCSCGQDCSCHGGEPGCVCASFEFFVCRASETNSP